MSGPFNNNISSNNNNSGQQLFPKNWPGQNNQSSVVSQRPEKLSVHPMYSSMDLNTPPPSPDNECPKSTHPQSNTTNTIPPNTVPISFLLNPDTTTTTTNGSSTQHQPQNSITFNNDQPPPQQQHYTSSTTISNPSLEDTASTLLLFHSQPPPPLPAVAAIPTSVPHSPHTVPNESPVSRHQEIGGKKQKKYRFRICDAPNDILKKIGRDSYAATIAMNANTVTAPSSATSDDGYSSSITSVINPKNHKLMPRHRSRKNPYPMRSPSAIPTETTATFTANWHHAYLATPVTISEKGMVSSDESSSICSPKLGPKRHRVTKSKTKREGGGNQSERRRKGNSLARVMADRGLLESTFNSAAITNNGESKAVRLPPPPLMEFSDLIRELNELDLNNSVLETKPKITWKGSPLSIQHLPHYDQLHRNEAYVAAILRLTPVQYLTAKHTLVSASRRYEKRTLPFRKSDAQKLLRIDVNKASKLWEFFSQIKWIW